MAVPKQKTGRARTHPVAAPMTFALSPLALCARSAARSSCLTACAANCGYYKGREVVETE